MTLADVKGKTLGPLLAVPASIIAMTGSIEARQGGAQVPVVSNDPVAQRQIEAMLERAANVRLDPNARAGAVDLRDRPLKEIIDAVVKAGGIGVRYASDTTGLDRPSTISLSDETVEDALRAVLKGEGLTFQAAGAKMAFVYPDTPANREKYTVSNRVFVLTKGDPTTMAQELNRALRSPAEVFQPMIFSVRDPATLIVRATPEVMARAAAWITEHDKDH